MRSRKDRKSGDEANSGALERARTAETKIKNLTFQVLENWMKDNQYIQTGYRPMSRSFRRSFASVFAVHNETVNIWTHLLPGMFSLCLAIWLLLFGRQHLNSRWPSDFLQRRYPTASSTDFWVITIFITGMTLMFFASWTYHTVSNHSHGVSKNWNKLDYVGIILMIIGSFVPSVYYGHYCEPQAISFYLTLLSSFGLVAFFFTILNRFRTSAWRPYRAGMFVLLGLSAVVPVIEALSTHGLERVQKEMSLWHCVAQGVLYILGAFIYANRFPERYYPKTFDIVGSSHQIFHCCVVLAGAIHAIGVWEAFIYRHEVLSGYCELL